MLKTCAIDVNNFHRITRYAINDGEVQRRKTLCLRLVILTPPLRKLPLFAKAVSDSPR